MQHLSDWFASYGKAFGTFKTSTKDGKGKMAGDAFTMRQPLTRKHWDDHLNGTGPAIGTIALLEDNTVRWGCADIDVYKLDLNELSIKIKDSPLVLFRSKSGGAHLICFVTEPVPAEDMIALLSEMAARLGFGGCEIFPKQTSRASESDVGNWLNMPYANHSRTMRYAIKEGIALDLEQALAFIEEKALTPEAFASVDTKIGSEPAAPEAPGDDRPGKPKRKRMVAEPTGERFSDGPPCLQYLAEQGGFGSGVRNEGMFNVGVYVKKKFPDNWRDELINFRDMCDPPMDVRELHTTIEKSLGRKEYSFRCNQAPIAPCCNRPLCLKREFGVGEMAGGGAQLGGLTKYEGTPVLWVIEVDGRRLELSTEDLVNQAAFARKCAEILTMYPRQVPAPRWAEYLHEQMKVATIVPAEPDEETAEGHFWVLVERFCTQRAAGTSKDQVLTNYPYTHEGWTWFRGAALLEFLNKAGFKYKTNREITKMLEDKGFMRASWDLKNGSVNVWGVPEFKEVADEKKELPPELGAEKEEF